MNSFDIVSLKKLLVNENTLIEPKITMAWIIVMLIGKLRMMLPGMMAVAKTVKALERLVMVMISNSNNCMIMEEPLDGLGAKASPAK